mmetsp:Transcript_53768/g.111074  ORF Transcript_53768/g.111074 Transcript_53768/m.111074 type:complete len:172 (+) Transcript_53768:18-533(+)
MSLVDGRCRDCGRRPRLRSELGIEAQEPSLQHLQKIALDDRMKQLELERQQAWAILEEIRDPEERLQYRRELLEMDEELENQLLFIDRVTLRCHEWIQEASKGKVDTKAEPSRASSELSSSDRAILDSLCLTPRRREKAEKDPRYREKLKRLYGITSSAAGSVVDSTVTHY